MVSPKKNWRDARGSGMSKHCKERWLVGGAPAFSFEKEGQSKNSLGPVTGFKVKTRGS